MSDLSDSQVLGSRCNAFDGDEDHQEDSFIPTSISKEEVATGGDTELGLMSSTDIERMVQELTNREQSKFETLSLYCVGRGSPAHSRCTPGRRGRRD
uniref:Uncharacterized protein n=1 Tax=Cannabis sativa TaxID=3483 RepID=A0A803PL41_CANSA